MGTVNLMKSKRISLDKWFFHYGDIKKWEDERLSDIMHYHKTTQAGGRIGDEEYWKNNNGKVDHDPSGINSKDSADGVCGAL